MKGYEAIARKMSIIKELNNENVKAYTDFEIIDLSKKKQIWSNLFFNSLIAIPTAFYGEYSDITRIVIPLIIILSAVWVVYLSFEIEKNGKVSFYIWGVLLWSPRLFVCSLSIRYCLRLLK